MCINDCPLLEDESPIGIYINIFGDIYPCQLITNKDFIIGTLKGFDERQLRFNISQIKDKVKERLNIDYGCSNCFLNNICKKGCFAKAIVEENNYLATDNCCSLRRKQFLHLLLEEK